MASVCSIEDRAIFDAAAGMLVEEFCYAKCVARMLADFGPELEAEELSDVADLYLIEADKRFVEALLAFVEACEHREVPLAAARHLRRLLRAGRRR